MMYMVLQKFVAYGLSTEKKDYHIIIDPKRLHSMTVDSTLRLCDIKIFKIWCILYYLVFLILLNVLIFQKQ